MNADITVVVVTWNSAPYLPTLLDSLQAQSDCGWHLVVVDNASQDGTLALLPPGAQVVRNRSNRGFAPAANQGIALATTPWVLLLNPDVVLDPGYLAALRDALQADPAAASATGTLYADEGRRVLDSTGHIVRRGGITWNREQPQAHTNEVFGVSAAAALYRRAALLDAASADGVLAESFFAYYEDVDLDWRLRWRGWRALHVPAATAVHRRSASGARRSAPLRRRQLANDLLLLVRIYPGSWLVGHLSVIARIWLGTLLRTAVRHPGDLAGLGIALRNLPMALRVRRRVMGSRRVEERAMEAWLQPLPWSWLPRRKKATNADV